MTEQEKAFLKYAEDVKKRLVPYKTDIPKIRLGEDGDGGYVCADLDTHDCLYSFGSDDNIRFENAFYKKYEKPSYVYDHTIDSITNKPDHIHFFKRGILERNTIDCLIEDNGHTGCKNLCLQCDIEGWEWRTLRWAKYLKNFSQMVIEFHMAWSQDVLETLDRLNEDFVMVHIHGNNSLLRPWFDVNLPCVFEVTYVRKDLVKTMEVDYGDYPTELDAPNSCDRPDMDLKWWKVN